LVVMPAMPASAQKAPPEITVTEADNGKDVTLRRGQTLIVRLAAAGAYRWLALMTPGSQLAFADRQPAPQQQKQPASVPGREELPMMGGPSHQVMAFRPARFTESSAESFMLIFCNPGCDLKDTSAKLFTLNITTTRKDALLCSPERKERSSGVEFGKRLRGDVRKRSSTLGQRMSGACCQSDRLDMRGARHVDPTEQCVRRSASRSCFLPLDARISGDFERRRVGCYSAGLANMIGYTFMQLDCMRT
jgi:hypothetical protein